MSGVYRRHPATSNPSAPTILSFLRSSSRCARVCREIETCKYGDGDPGAGEENDMLIDTTMKEEDGRRL
jgi:hypothetical protein